MNSALKTENATARGITGQVSAPPGFALPRLAQVANSRATLFFTAAFLSLTFLTLPRFTLGTDVESAWSSVLAYAHQNGLQFGTELVYPYGPLGFLLVPHFIPGTGVGRLLFDCALCFGVSLGVCFLAWRCKPISRLLLITLFMVLAANKGSGLQDLLFDLGLLTWGLLCLVDSSPRLPLFYLVLLSFAVVGSLAKITILATAGLTVLAVSLALWLRGRRWGSLFVFLSFLAGVLGLWMFLGQHLSNLPLFIQRALLMCSGYDQTMALEPSTPILTGGIVVALLACLLVIVRCSGAICLESPPGQSHRWLVLFWLLCSLFLSWKHGFVRADPHHTYLFFAFSVIFILSLEVLPVQSHRRRQWSWVIAAAACVTAVTTLQISAYPKTLRLDRCFSQLPLNAHSLLAPQSYLNEMNDCLNQERHIVELPGIRRVVGAAPVDLFGNYQVYATLGGFNFRPRPIFQSYAAYSASLMALNQTLYLSPAAPPYVLATLSPIDHHFPPLEDALTLRTLLLNYRLLGTERGFLLLQSQSTAPPRLTLAGQGTVPSGAPINLAPFGQTNLWLAVDLEPTLLGRLRQLLLQLPKPRLQVCTGAPNQPVQEFAAPAPMLTAGFVASPLLTTDSALFAFYSGKPLPRPSAYTVTFGPRANWFWKPLVRFRVYEFQAGSPCPVTQAAAEPVRPGAS